MTEPPAIPPAGNLTGGDSHPEVADALRPAIDRIVTRWEQLILNLIHPADEPTWRVLRSHLPQALAGLADAMASRSDGPRIALGNIGTQHAGMPVDGELNIRDLLAGYRLLRQIAIHETEELLGRRMTHGEILALAAGIDLIIEAAVRDFIELTRKRLRGAAESEARFVNYLSHDLRNQLHGTSLIIDLLAEKLRDNPAVAREIAQAKKIQRSIVDTVSGMERLLQFVRLHRGEELRRVAVNLRELASDIAAEFSATAEKKNIQIQLMIPCEMMVNTDRGLLHIVLQNLVGNAVKFSEHGVIRVMAESTPNGSTLIVADEGPGIALEMQQRIFGEFVQGMDGDVRGAGLGLAIAWEAAKLLGCQLTVESMLGSGATFRLLGLRLN